MRPALRTILFGGAQERYLLRDDFSDTLAAGSVNGTVAPGLGTVAQRTRTVVDIENKLSQANGLSVYAGGKAAPAWGDPGRWYGSFPRVPGLMILFKIVPISGLMGTGYSVAQSGVVSGIEFRWTGGSLTIGNAPVLFSYTGGVIYTVAIILRSTGYMVFLKGGVFASWMLLFVENKTNTGQYPAFPNYNSTNTLDYVYIPVSHWLPTPLASDGMVSAALTNGTGHSEGVVGGIGSGGANVPWATAATWSVAGGVTLNTPNLGAEQNNGALVIGTWYKITASEADHFYVGSAVGDHFRATATTALDANNKVQPFTTAELFRPLNQAMTADVVAQITNVAQTDRTVRGLAIRLNDPTAPTSGIIAYYDGLGNIKVAEFSGATYTQLFTAAKAWADSDRLQLIANGSSVRLYHITSAGGYTLIGSSATAMITTGGYHGLFSTDPGNTLDNMVLYPRGTGSEYAILDSPGKMPNF
jgi:hypothetical protein